MSFNTYSIENAWKYVSTQLNRKDYIIFREKIKVLLKRENAVLVSHYYTNPEIQELAEETGGCVADSLEMARFGYKHPAQTLVVAGVRFMGETAKILSPKKRILMPDINATCSLDLGCSVDNFTKFCNNYPDRTIVVYTNTSAAVKACADWVVSSSIALQLIKNLHIQGKKILWAPDRHLGTYIREKTRADMILWKGSCIVHDEFKATELKILKKKYPKAKVLVHPESPIEVIALADVVGSTTQLINAVRTLNTDCFIVATDVGVFFKMKAVAPGKKFIEAPTAGKSADCKSCAHCPWMAMNVLQNLAKILETPDKQIEIHPEIIQRALLPIKRMLDFTISSNISK